MLIDDRVHVRVADFGFATEAAEDTGFAVRDADRGPSGQYRRRLLGTDAFMAPERLVLQAVDGSDDVKREVACQKSDVWSFGVLLLELCHGCVSLACVRAVGEWSVQLRSCPFGGAAWVDRMFGADSGMEDTAKLMQDRWMRRVSRLGNGLVRKLREACVVTCPSEHDQVGGHCVLGFCNCLSD